MIKVFVATEECDQRGEEDVNESRLGDAERKRD